MSLLYEIQAALLDEETELGPILLKLRFLAARLGSDVLGDWVQHEMNGYPEDISIPDYRTASISYSGTFSNGYQTLNDIAIPAIAIKKHAGEGWLRIHIRDPLAVIDGIVARMSNGTRDEKRYGVPTGNLRLLLRDKLYKDLPLIDLYSEFNTDVFVKIKSVVRAKVLELTLGLEKNVPGATDIVIGKLSDTPKIDPKGVSNITQQLINYGTVTNIQSSGNHAAINIQVAQGDKNDLVRALTEGGLPEEDAIEFAEIAASETPDREKKTFGKRAQEWLGDKISKGSAAAWKVGLSVGTEILTKAALKYYGLDT
jgi:AbiTii-like protein